MESHVAHSIPELNALIIRHRGRHGPAHRRLEDRPDTGDRRRRPTRRKLAALGDEGVLALIGDSTNAVREGRSPSESDVVKTLTELIRTAPARVAVTTFASHVGRVRAVAQAARGQ